MAARSKLQHHRNKICAINMINNDSLTGESRRVQLQLDTRRQFLTQCATGLGSLFLAQQLSAATNTPQHRTENPLSETAPHFEGKVKRVIYLHMIGAPSQLELFDYKPTLNRLDGKPCRKSCLKERTSLFAGHTEHVGPPVSLQATRSIRAWISDRLPHLSKHADQLCFIKTMQTDQFNHGPAQLMVHTGNARIGYPSIGSWVTWGLGTENEDLPGFVVSAFRWPSTTCWQGPVGLWFSSVGVSGSPMPK